MPAIPTRYRDDPELVAVVLSARRLQMDGDDEGAFAMLKDSGRFWTDESATRVLVNETFHYKSLYPDGHPERNEIAKKQAADQRRRYRANKHKKKLGEVQGWRCRYCNADVSGARKASVDHVIPIERGGSDDYDNLQVLCLACNQSKGGRTDEEYHAMLESVAAHHGIALADVRNRRSAEARLSRCGCKHYGCEPDCIGCAYCKDNHASLDNVLCWNQPGEDAMVAYEHDMAAQCDKPKECMSARRCLNPELFEETAI